MGDGIAGPVLKIMSGSVFKIVVSHTRKDNNDEYGRLEKIMIANIDGHDGHSFINNTSTPKELEVALSGRFVSCDVQYRDVKTDALVCNVFIQNPPKEF